MEEARVELERRRRIRLSVAAYTYEYKNESVISDAEYDQLSLLIDLKIKTGNKKMDKFFEQYFDKDSGMWIRKHPDKSGLENIYQRVWREAE